MSFVVEICGPSGVGKTTTLCKMMEEVNVIYLNKYKSHRIEKELIRPATLNFINFVNKTFNEGTGSRIETRREHTLRSLKQLLVGKDLDDLFSNIAIIDGGLVHRGTTLELANPEVDLIKYYRLMPLPDLIVYFRDTENQIKLRNRGRYGAHDRSNDIDRILNVYKKGMRELSYGRNANISHLWVADTPEETARDLHNIINNAIKDAI